MFLKSRGAPVVKVEGDTASLACFLFVLVVHQSVAGPHACCGWRWQLGVARVLPRGQHRQDLWH